MKTTDYYVIVHDSKSFSYTNQSFCRALRKKLKCYNHKSKMLSIWQTWFIQDLSELSKLSIIN